MGTWCSRSRRVAARSVVRAPAIRIASSGEDPLTDAETLAEWVAVDGRLPLADVLSTGVKLAGALETAHQLGVVHGAVSAHTVIVSASGEPQLVWVGRSRGREGSRRAAADVAGLGVALMTLATGQPMSGVAQRAGPFLREQGVPDEIVDALLVCAAPFGGPKRLSARAAGVALQEAQEWLGLPVTELVVPPRPCPAPWVTAVRGQATDHGCQGFEAQTSITESATQRSCETVAIRRPGGPRAPNREGVRRRSQTSLTWCLAAVATLVLTPGQATAQAGAHGSRIVPEGASNPAISVAFSQAAFSPSATNAALLARDDLWVDALASGGLQGTLDAPLLLSAPQALSPETLDELERLEVSSVYVLGGPEALAPGIDEQLRAVGLEVERVAGEDRIATAVEAARRFMPDADTALLLPGYDSPGRDTARGYVDGLAAGALAARRRYPVLLTDPSSLSAGTRDYIRESAIRTILIPGGAATVGESVIAELARLGMDIASPITIGRVGGIDRFDTAARIAADGGRLDRVLVLEGNSMRVFAASYAAAALAARTNAAVVLVDGGSMPPQTADFLRSRTGPVVCGPAVEEQVCDRAAGLVGAGGAGA